MQQDTDQHRAITLKHLSPTWVELIDEEYGEAKRKNKGHAELHARFDGDPKPQWFEFPMRFLREMGHIVRRDKARKTT